MILQQPASPHLKHRRNNSLRLTIGGITATPTLPLQLYMGNLPTASGINSQAAISLSKIKVLPQINWAKNSNLTPHLKTQLLPTSTANQYLRYLDIPQPPSTKPIEYQRVNTNLSLISEANKHDIPSTLLHQVAFPIINERYINNEYLCG